MGLGRPQLWVSMFGPTPRGVLMTPGTHHNLVLHVVGGAVVDPPHEPRIKPLIWRITPKLCDVVVVGRLERDAVVSARTHLAHPVAIDSPVAFNALRTYGRSRRQPTAGRIAMTRTTNPGAGTE